MKKIILILFVLVSVFCYGQKKYPKPQVDTLRVTKESIHPIKTKKDSAQVHGAHAVAIENSDYKNGSLAFLIGCTWETNKNSDFKIPEKEYNSYIIYVQFALEHYKELYVYNIKKKMPDGTVKHLPSVYIKLDQTK